MWFPWAPLPLNIFLVIFVDTNPCDTNCVLYWLQRWLNHSCTQKTISHNRVCTAARVHHWPAQAKAGIKPVAGKSGGQQSQGLIQLDYPFHGTLLHCVRFGLVLLGRSFCSRKPRFLEVSREKYAGGMIVKKIFFLKKFSSEQQLSAAEGCFCLFPRRVGFWVILPQSNQGMKSIVPPEKKLILWDNGFMTLGT
jgi:hypothetical protein